MGICPPSKPKSMMVPGALTIATARAIEERLFRKQFHREWIIAVGLPDESSSAMLISVDRDRQIIGADRSARLMLSSGHDRLEQGIGLWAIFEQNDALFRHMDRGDILTEVSPRGSAESWPAIVTPPEPALARWSQSGSEELRLRSRLDTLAISRHVSKPSRAHGGLPPATLRRIRDYVDSHLDQNIELESLAATAELSLYHFARSFKQSEGTTPHAFVLERRLARARELLTRPDLSLSEVAFAVGFADQSHFTRRFRQMVGISPGQFRKLQRTTSIVASTSVSGESCG